MKYSCIVCLSLDYKEMSNMSSTVYLFRIDTNTSPKQVRKGLSALLRQKEISNSLTSKGFTAIKMHFGESDSPNTVEPSMVKVIVNYVKSAGGRPFLTDTNTLYTGRRSNAVDHLMCAYSHGYTMKNTGAPAIILDGLTGKGFAEIPIGLKHCKTAKIAKDVLNIDDLIGITHVTGHEGASFGGSLKNIGMGMSSRGGKQKQHSGILPEVDKDRCTACGECARWCPVEAITVDEHAHINKGLCIGCGECTVTCRFKAIAVRWDESSANLQEKIAEHAYAVVRSIRGKSCFFNFLIKVTKDCDCIRRPQDPDFTDLGIVASTDIVAADKASYDLLEQEAGRDMFQEWSGKDPLVQMRYGEEIGLGTTDYILEQV